VYLERDFNGFIGDRKFIRDDDAQKAFSKLRSSIAGIYSWRLGMLTGVPTPQQYNANYKSPAERERMAKEADFAFKQAFAFCPFSPEAVYRYVSFLISFNRTDDALLVAATCLKLDPYNGSIQGLVKQLMGFKENRVTVAPPSAVPPGQSVSNIQHLEQEVRENPTNFQAAFGLVSAYLQSQQSDKAAQTLDQILANPHADVNVVVAVANGFAQLRDVARLQAALEKLVQVDPQSPEAWYDLATIRVSLGRNPEGITALRKAMELNAARLVKNSKASNLLIIARTDSRFAALRQMPEFQKIVPSAQAEGH
jgi:thioredoxin-like negative regulator of GroEL